MGRPNRLKSMVQSYVSIPDIKEPLIPDTQGFFAGKTHSPGQVPLSKLNALGRECRVSAP